MSESTDSAPVAASNTTAAAARGNGPGPTNRHGAGAATAAERVGTIVAAAEQAAEQIRLRTESRMRARIAEGERAAQNRIRAAEEEAADILRMARAEEDHGGF